MKHLLPAAVFGLILAACAPQRPPATAGQGLVRIGFISEPGAGGTRSPEAAAAAFAGIQATIADPPRHPTHPARNRQLVIPSGPVRPELSRPAEMNALFLLAAGEGPKPTLLLLHGLPGNERNMDLAEAVRRAGWNVLTFTYRGAWGSEGTFSLQHAVDDAEAALRFLRSEAAVRTYGIDIHRIVIAGHSMGGYIAARWAADSAGRQGMLMSCFDCSDARQAEAEEWHRAPPLAGVVLLDAWDIATDVRELRAAGPQGRVTFIAGFDDLGHALGPITAADIYANLMRLGEDEWGVSRLVPGLARIPTLTIYATHGGADRNRALAAAIRAACARPPETFDPPSPCATLTAVELATDHAFADHRVALAREVVGWLEDSARE